MKNEKFSRRVSTGENGKFAFTGLAPGDYSIATLPDSYPPGYALQDLPAQTITVEPGKPASTQFKIRALRSIAERLLEARQRGLWDASDDAVATLRDAVLEAEGWEESR